MKLFKNLLLIVSLLATFPAQPMKRKGGDPSEEPAAKVARTEQQAPPAPIRHVCVQQPDPANPTIPTVVLQSSEGEEFEVARTLAEQSVTCHNMLNDLGAADPIPCHNIDAQTLGTVITCLQDMQNAPIIIQTMPINELHQFILAVNFLDIAQLLNLCLHQWADIWTTPEALEAFKNNPIQHPAFDENLWLPADLCNVTAQIIVQKYELAKFVIDMINPLIATSEGCPLPAKKVSTCNKIIAACSDTTIKISILTDDRKWKCIQILEGHNGFVTAVCFSPNGKILASASTDQTTKLWTVGHDGKWQCFKTLRGHNDRVCSVCFSADGRTLTSSSLDETIMIWNADALELLSEFMFKKITLKQALLFKLILDDHTAGDIFDLTQHDAHVLEIFQTLPEELRTLLVSKNIINI